MIISIHSPNQEALEYPQKDALILHLKKFYQVHLAHSTGHDYLGHVQFDLVDTYVCFRCLQMSPRLLPVFFDLRVVRQIDKGTYTIHPWVVRFLLDMFCPVERFLV